MKVVAGWAAVVLLPLLVLGGLIAAQRDPTRPNFDLPTQMAASPAASPQSANAVLPGGMTMQPPVPGTLARDEQPFDYAATDADRHRAGRELVNPLPPTHENLAAARRAYDTFCSVCHGASGAGDGPLIPRFPNPPGFRSKQCVTLKDGELFHTITLGRKRMAGYAGQVPWEDRWRLVLQIREFQKGGSHAAR
jgi:hypothetical protein